jgi:hypothetical protein
MAEPNREELTPSTSEVDTQIARGDPDAVPPDVEAEERGPQPVPKLPPATHDEQPEMGEPTTTVTEAQE